MNPISQSRIELAAKINALMMIRILVLTTLFGMAFLISIKRFEIITPYYFIGGIYLFTGISAFLLKRVKNLFIFAHIQICFDVVFETGILYFTNGIYSPLIFLYIFSIIATIILDVAIAVLFKVCNILLFPSLSMHFIPSFLA